MVTAADLDACKHALPDPLFLDVQFVVDGVSVLLLVWALGRFIWDLIHRRPDIFPPDR